MVGSGGPWIVGALLVAVVVAIALAMTNSSDTSVTADSEELSTSTVRQQNLVVTETVSGTLGYGDAEAIAFRTSPAGVETVYGALSGVVTSAPNEGALVTAGGRPLRSQRGSGCGSLRRHACVSIARSKNK